MSKNSQYITCGNWVQPSVCPGFKPELTATILACFPAQDAKRSQPSDGGPQRSLLPLTGVHGEHKRRGNFTKEVTLELTLEE